jgi:hypothetical protein
MKSLDLLMKLVRAMLTPPIDSQLMSISRKQSDGDVALNDAADGSERKNSGLERKILAPTTNPNNERVARTERLLRQMPILLWNGIWSTISTRLTPTVTRPKPDIALWTAFLEFVQYLYESRSEFLPVAERHLVDFLNKHKSLIRSDQELTSIVDRLHNYQLVPPVALHPEQLFQCIHHELFRLQPWTSDQQRQEPRTSSFEQLKRMSNIRRTASQSSLDAQLSKRVLSLGQLSNRSSSDAESARPAKSNAMQQIRQRFISAG